MPSLLTVKPRGSCLLPPNRSLNLKYAAKAPAISSRIPMAFSPERVKAACTQVTISPLGSWISSCPAMPPACCQAE